MSWNHPHGHQPAYNPNYGGQPYGGAPQHHGNPGQQHGNPGQQHSYGGQPHGGQQYGQYGPPPTTHGYGSPPGPPPGVDMILWQWFQSVDQDRSGKITASELRQALVNSNWSNFNAETCRLMIGMFDKDGSGTIDINEFSALWKYIQQWKNCFDSFDADHSGTIDARELNTALSTFGYRLSPQFCNLCVQKFDHKEMRTMKFDDFIQCCVTLKSLTDAFKKHDTKQAGVITISYEQFLEMVLANTLSGI